MRDAILAVADTAAPLRPYGAEGPLVQAIAIKVVREEFNRAYPADNPDPTKADAKRQAWGRAFKAARHAELIVVGRERDTTAAPPLPAGA